MATIHLVGGEKGGVGKSVVARLLAQYFIDHKLDFSAFDGDASHGAMLRYYAESSEPVQLAEFESLDRIVDTALEGADRVLVDLPAQCKPQLEAWVESCDLIGLAQEGELELRLWHVTDGGFDSVKLLGPHFGKAARYVVVRNHGRTRDFSQLDDSEELAAIRDIGGAVVDVPELHSAAMYHVDRHSSSFWAAVNDQTSPYQMRPMDRRRVRKWLAECYRALDPLADWL